MEYYTNNIQIDKTVIKDIFENMQQNTKMLVFGLGYDSKMWYEGNNKNTFFIENKDQYIELNKDHISSDNIIKYDYTTTCESSYNLTDQEINMFNIPTRILQLAPFDIILIDGPEGYSKEKPGLLIPCYWSTLLSKTGTLIYIDDSKRKLESYCITKYFNDKIKDVFSSRDNCTKIYF
jgi:hypothetical protein